MRLSKIKKTNHTDSIELYNLMMIEIEKELKIKKEILQFLIADIANKEIFFEKLNATISKKLLSTSSRL